MSITIALAASRTIQPPVTVAGTSNAGGLIQIQTSVAHNLLTNDIVQIAGVGGTIEANQQAVITKVDATHFTLNNSSFSNAFTSSSGQVMHCGFVAGSALVDTAVYPTPPDFTLTTRVESVAPGSILRVHFEDAVDAAFVTAQPLATFQTEASNGDGLVMSTKREDAGDARIGLAGAHVRLKVFISGGAWSSAQLSAWIV